MLCRGDLKHAPKAEKKKPKLKLNEAGTLPNEARTGMVDAASGTT